MATGKSKHSLQTWGRERVLRNIRVFRSSMLVCRKKNKKSVGIGHSKINNRIGKVLRVGTLSYICVYCAMCELRSTKYLYVVLFEM